jgi:uncharacterized membrane protein YciS (DUF1049 family)
MRAAGHAWHKSCFTCQVGKIVFALLSEGFIVQYKLAAVLWIRIRIRLITLMRIFIFI